MTKETLVKFQILEDKEVDKEVKLLLILEMLHQKEIDITKAKELCTEIGIFSEHWLIVDTKANEIFQKYYANLM